VRVLYDVVNKGDLARALIKYYKFKNIYRMLTVKLASFTSFSTNVRIIEALTTMAGVLHNLVMVGEPMGSLNMKS
jgi:hypothetical protein